MDRIYAFTTMKPHLYRLSTLWHCIGRKVVGVGASPAEAYKDWYCRVWH